MSLILEALRKSEAERQIGRLPGLMTPTAPLRRRRSRTPRVLAGLLLLALIAGSGWWLGRNARVDGERTPAPPTSSPASDADPALTSTSSDNAEAAQTPATAPSPTPASSPIPSPAPAPTPTPPAAVPSPPAPTALTLAPAATPAPAASPAPEAAPQATPSSPGGAAPPTAAPAAPLVLEPPLAYPTLEQMPSVQRSALPTLKLSVHVYAEDASRRFAVVDGRRVREGDSLSSDVRIREIRRDGLLLDVGGQPWLLARPH